MEEQAAATEAAAATATAAAAKPSAAAATAVAAAAAAAATTKKEEDEDGVADTRVELKKPNQAHTQNQIRQLKLKLPNSSLTDIIPGTIVEAKFTEIVSSLGCPFANMCI